MAQGNSRFIVFFEGKEGTSPLVRLLDNFAEVAIVHQEGGVGWEPFDPHNCGVLPLRDLERCLDAIFDRRPADLTRVNAIYTRTATRPLAFDVDAPILGFKMRFQPPQRWPAWTGRLRRSAQLSAALATSQQRRFARMMLALLARREVTAFVVVRRDALRWSLSKYVGDGTGRPGHLQFRVARGEIRGEDLTSFAVDLERLAQLIAGCEASFARKRQLLDALARAGVRAFPVFYEQFLADRAAYLRDWFERLGTPMAPAAVAAALERGAHFQKVHDEDISTFVINHAEVLARYGRRARRACAEVASIRTQGVRDGQPIAWLVETTAGPVTNAGAFGHVDRLASGCVRRGRVRHERSGGARRARVRLRHRLGRHRDRRGASAGFDALPVWEPTPAPIVAIGRIDGAAPYLFGRVLDAVRLSDGHDRRGGRIRVTGQRRAALLRRARHVPPSVGPDGRGPGEFSLPQVVERMAGDSIAVWDRDRQKVSLLAPDGAAVREWSTVACPGRLSADGASPCYSPIGFLDDASLVVSTSSPIYAQGNETGPKYGRPVTIGIVRERAWSELGVLLQGDQYWAEFDVRPGRRAVRPYSRIYGGRPYWTANAEIGVFARNDSSDIRVIGTDDRLVRLIRWAVQPRRVRAADIALYRDHDWGEERATAGAWIDGLEPGATVPLYGELRIDEAGRGIRRGGV